MFNQYRLLLGSISAFTADEDVAVVSSRLAADSADYQRRCYNKVRSLETLAQQHSLLRQLCLDEHAALTEMKEESKDEFTGQYTEGG